MYTCNKYTQNSAQSGKYQKTHMSYMQFAIIVFHTC